MDNVAFDGLIYAFRRLDNATLSWLREALEKHDPPPYLKGDAKLVKDALGVAKVKY